MRPQIAVVLTIALAVLPGAVLAQSPPSPAFLVIVHPKNSVTSVSRQFLADAFLKKKTRWSDDTVIHPVDLDSRSAVRRQFSSDVLRRPVAAVRSYWRQIIFSGRGVPPPELATDEAVVAYVLRHEGAIGYVSGAANPTGVKIVPVR